MTNISVEQLLNVKDSNLLIESLSVAATNLNLSQEALTKVVGLEGALKTTTNLTTKQSENAISFIRVYISLYSHFDGNFDHMRLWLTGFDNGTQGVPLEQIQNEEGLVTVMEYLEAMQNGNY